MISLNDLKYEQSKREAEEPIFGCFTIPQILACFFNEQRIKNFLDIDWRSLNDELGKWYDDVHIGIYDLLYSIKSIPLRVRLADFLAQNADNLFIDHACQYIEMECMNISHLFSQYNTYALTENDYMSELAQLKQRHEKLHQEYAALQSRENGHAMVIKGHEKRIKELQEEIQNKEHENQKLHEEIFYLKKELDLILNQNSPNQPQVTIPQQAPIVENSNIEPSQPKFQYIKSNEANVIAEIESELEPLMSGNNAAKVCDTLIEYQEQLNCPRKLPESIFDALEERWPTLQFSKGTFCQAWKRKQKK